MVSVAAVFAWGSEIAADAVDPLAKRISVSHTVRVYEFADRLSARIGIPVTLRTRDFDVAGTFYGRSLPFEAAESPAYGLLWSYVLRGDDALIFVVCRDSAGVPKGVELATWAGADGRDDPLPLDARDVPWVRQELLWGLDRDREDVALRALRVVARMGEVAAGLVPELEELARNRSGRLKAAFEDTLRDVTVRTLRSRTPHIPRLPLPAPEVWMTRKIALPERAWKIDEFAEAAADETGIPITIRYDDLARASISLNRERRFRADAAPLAEILWNFLLHWNLMWVVRRNERGEPSRIEIVSYPGLLRRGERLSEDPAAVEGLVLVLRDSHDRPPTGALNALHLLGAAAEPALPVLRPLAASRSDVRRLSEHISAAVEERNRKPQKFPAPTENKR